MCPDYVVTLLWQDDNMVDVAVIQRRVGPVQPRITTPSTQAATLVSQELARQGERLTTEGAELIEKGRIAQGNTELNSHRVEITAAMNDLDNKMRDSGDPNEFDGFLQEFNTRADNAAGLLTIPESQEKGSQWAALQKETGRGQVEVNIDTQRIANAVASYNATRALALETGDADLLVLNHAEFDELDGFDTDQESEAILAKDLIDIQQGRDAAAAEAVRNTVADSAFIEWQQTVTDENPDGDLTGALAVVNESILVAEEKQEVESEVKTRVNNRRLETKLQKENAATEDVTAIQKRINSGSLEGIEDQINASSAEEAEKSKLIAATRAETVARLKDDELASVYNQRDDAVYNQLLFQVRNDPFSITDPEIRDFTYKGTGTPERPGGITTGEYQFLASERLKTIDGLNNGTAVTSRDVVQRAHSSIGRTRSARVAAIGTVGQADTAEELAEKREVEETYQKRDNDLDVFAEANKDAPNFSALIEAETKRLLTPLREEATLNWFQRVLSLSPLGALGVIGEGRRLRNLAREQAEEREAALPRPTTPAELEAIPKGVIFMDTDGVPKRKL